MERVGRFSLGVIVVGVAVIAGFAAMAITLFVIVLSGHWGSSPKHALSYPLVGPRRLARHRVLGYGRSQSLESLALQPVLSGRPSSGKSGPSIYANHF